MARIRKILGSEYTLLLLNVLLFCRLFNVGAYLPDATLVDPGGAMTVTNSIQTTAGIGVGGAADTSDKSLRIYDDASAPVTAAASSFALSYDDTGKVLYFRNSSGTGIWLDGFGGTFYPYTQANEPTLPFDGCIAIWVDSDDSNRTYLVYRRGSGDQVKVELT